MNYFQKQLLDFCETHPEVTMEIDDSSKAQIEVRIKPPNYSEIKISIGESIEIERPGFFKEIKLKMFQKRQTYSDLMYCLFNEAWERNNKDEPLPKIGENEYLTFNVDSTYGQVLTVNGNKYIGWGEVYRIHQSYQEAEDYAIDMCSKKDVLCYIYDHKHKKINYNQTHRFDRSATNKNG